MCGKSIEVPLVQAQWTARAGFAAHWANIVRRKVPCGLPVEKRLTEDSTALTKEFGRYALPGRLLRTKRREGLPHDHRAC
jgi:hypothetical protein